MGCSISNMNSRRENRLNNKIEKYLRNNSLLGGLIEEMTDNDLKLFAASNLIVTIPKGKPLVYEGNLYDSSCSSHSLLNQKCYQLR